MGRWIYGDAEDKAAAAPIPNDEGLANGEDAKDRKQPSPGNEHAGDEGAAQAHSLHDSGQEAVTGRKEVCGKADALMYRSTFLWLIP